MYLQLRSKNQTARDKKTIFSPTTSKENMVNEQSPTLNHAFFQIVREKFNEEF